MRLMTDSCESEPRDIPSLLRRTGRFLAAAALMFIGGCASPMRTETASTASTICAADAKSSPAYVTVAVDDPKSEWEFVQWLRAGGVRVERDSNGDDRIYDSPACRAILVRYRRMLRVRLDLIAQNLAHVNETHDAQGAKNPYRRRFAVANADGTFEIREDPSPFATRHLPDHPDVDSGGYVQFPNVDPACEKVNASQTSLTYGVVTRLLTHLDPSFVGIEDGEGTTASSIPSTHDARFNDAVQQMLSNIIGTFPGVSDAKVTINANQIQPGEKIRPPTASVVIRTTGTTVQPDSLVGPAANTVANAVAGLACENVSIMINGVSYRISKPDH